MTTTENNGLDYGLTEYEATLMEQVVASSHPQPEEFEVHVTCFDFDLEDYLPVGMLSNWDLQFLK